MASFKRAWKPYLPQSGEYVVWKWTDHEIFDAFPDGQRVDPFTIGLDWTEPIKVVHSEQKMCWRKLKTANVWIVDCYVGIKFEHKDFDGTKKQYWTTWARGGYQWLRTWEEWKAAECY